MEQDTAAPTATVWSHQEPEDGMTRWVKVHVYLGYLYLLVRGVILDLAMTVAAVITGSDRQPQGEGDDYEANGGVTGACSSDERNVELLSGWVDFYVRRMYTVGQDCWNRPVRGAVGRRVQVLERTRDKDERMVMNGETRDCLNLGSYNYLGFAGQDPYCTPAARDSVFEYGIASCSSPCELGANKACEDLEGLIQTFLGGSPLKEEVMVFGMGFATNSHTLPALMGAGSLIISDSLNHTSIVEGARQAGAKVRVFAHNDPNDLDAVLFNARNKGQERKGKPFEPWSKILVIVEGTYSMEGEMCKLPELVRVKNKYGAYLYLDEAHSIGALGENGRGVCEKLGVDPSEVDIMMGTLTKSFGSFGGYIASSAAVINALRTKSASAIYSNGMSPPCAVQAHRALELIRGDDGSTRGKDKIRQLKNNATLFYDGLRKMGAVVLGPGDSPVVPMMIYHPTKMFAFSRQCFEQQIAAVVVGFPAVPLLLSRARFCVSASHTTEDLEAALEQIEQVCKKLGLCYKPPAAESSQIVAAAEPLVVHEFDVSKLPEWESSALAPEDLQASCWRPTTAQLSSATVQLSTYNFLGLRKHLPILEVAAQVIEEFGVGSCGPRGFYGTLEPHLQLEKDIAEFMGTEASILYSFGSTTISSVIPAFAKPTDVLVMDDGINYNAQQGARLSRAKALFFRHNDMAHLEEVLAELEREDGLHSTRLTSKAVRRRFLVTEGVFANSGELAPLVELNRLKLRHALRLILDDSLGFGVLGEHGRGTLEHFGLPVQTADILIGSLETVCAAVGGFCCGSNLVVDHQRLSGAGYVFSASLPPFLCSAASKAIECIKLEPERRQRLSEATCEMRAALAQVTGCQVSGSKHSPMMLVRWPGATEEIIDQLAMSLMQKSQIAATQARFCPLEKSVPEPALRVCVMSEFEGAQLTKVCCELAKALSTAIKQSPESSTNSEAASGSAEASPVSKRLNQPIKKHQRKNSQSHMFFDAAKTVDNASDRVGGDKLELQQHKSADWRDKATERAGSYFSIPIFSLFAFFLQNCGNYLEQQVTWGQKTTLRTLTKIRNPITDSVFLIFSILGSEYVVMSIGLWLSWNYNAAIGRMLLTLYVVNLYLGSFTKNVFCLKRPTGTGDSDFGWPSIHCMTITSLPFFLLRCLYGHIWLWDQADPSKTVFVFASVFVLCFLVITARLYFGRSSPADVQAGCFMGAGMLRLWLPYAATVDRAVLNATSPWPLLGLAILALVLHPVPRRANLNDTFIMTVKMVGFSTGYLLGFIGPAVLLGSPVRLPSSTLLATVRWSVGLSLVFATQWVASEIYLKLSERILRFFTGSKKGEAGRYGVHISLRNTIRCAGFFLANCAAGGVASWGMPHLFSVMDAIWPHIPFSHLF